MQNFDFHVAKYMFDDSKRQGVTKESGQLFAGKRGKRKGSVYYSDAFRGHNSLKRLDKHRTVSHAKRLVDKRTKNHINSLEGFWGYLKRKLSTKGGIRRKMLHLYLGEYAWRYNHRNQKFKQQERSLLTTLFKHS